MKVKFRTYTGLRVASVLTSVTFPFDQQKFVPILETPDLTIREGGRAKKSVEKSQGKGRGRGRKGKRYGE